MTLNKKLTELLLNIFHLIVQYMRNIESHHLSHILCVYCILLLNDNNNNNNNNRLIQVEVLSDLMRSVELSNDVAVVSLQQFEFRQLGTDSVLE